MKIEKIIGAEKIWNYRTKAQFPVGKDKNGSTVAGFFSPKKTNPIGRVFWLFPELNASAFARRLGIPQPLFAAYVNGTKKPSSARKKLIDEELRRIGKELLKTVA